MRKPSTFLFGPIAAGLLLSGTAIGLAQTTPATNGNKTVKMSTDNGTVKTKSASSNTMTTTANPKGDKADAKDIVNGAVKGVNEMQQDKQLAKLIKKARGVFVIPDFGRGGFIMGGRGGAGVMLAKRNGRWTDPAFFDFGGISLGAQVGGSGGSVAFLLMSKGAVNAFNNGNQFSLNGGAGLSIVTYSANAQTSAGKGDIVFWSNTNGVYAGASVSVSDINWDNENNQGYYDMAVTPRQLTTGKITAKKGVRLKTALLNSNG